jgi:small subunit ribosomal protein S21
MKPASARKGSYSYVKTTISEVKVRRGEPLEKALRRLKKKLDKEGTMREVRAHRHYEKPSDRRRRKAARARIRSSY